MSLLSILCIFFIVRDYQIYHFNVEYWFSWISYLIITLCLLTINYQSLYLGSLKYQYLHYDTPFEIARIFPQAKYAFLIKHLERRLKFGERGYYTAKIIFVLLLLVAFILAQNQVSLSTLFTSFVGQPIIFIAHVLLMFTLIALSLAASIFILVRQREMELLELSHFWIKSASFLKYIE